MRGDEWLDGVISYHPEVGHIDSSHAVQLVPTPRGRIRGHFLACAAPAFDQCLDGATASALVLPYRPEVVGSESGYSTQAVLSGPLVGTGDHLPAGAVPVFDQRLAGAVTAAVRRSSHDPEIAGIYGSYTEKVVIGPNVGTGDNLPAGAVPMFDQRGCATAVLVVPYHPEVGGAKSSNSGQVVIPRPRAGAGDDLPAGAVPVFDERLEGNAPVRGVAHGPDVGRIDRGYSTQEASNVGAGDDLPAGAIPVFDQRLICGVVRASHGPDVGSTDGGRAAQGVGTCPDVRAGDHLPTGAIPVFDQRL